MVFTCCCKRLKARQVMDVLAAGLHRGQAPVKGSQSQCTLGECNIHVETAKKTAQMMFTALACGFESEHARYTLPSRCNTLQLISQTELHMSRLVCSSDGFAGLFLSWVSQAPASETEYKTDRAELHVKDSCGIAHS